MFKVLDTSLMYETSASAVTYPAELKYYEVEGFETATTKIPQVLEAPARSSIEEEYPEVVELSRKLKNNEELTEADEWNLNEIVEASGWSREDVEEDLKNLDADPKGREERYWSLFKKYYEEAMELKSKGDDLQAAEKMWGAITALIKAYAARKRILVEYWSRGKLNHFVANNAEAKLRRPLEDLLTYGEELHEHFYEEKLPPTKLNRRWKQCTELIKEIEAEMKTSL